jgi:Ca2+-binding RTX toxin-like protein
MAAAALLDTGRSWNSYLGQPAAVTWAAASTGPYTHDAAGYRAPFEQLSPSQIYMASVALGNISDVAAISFSQVNAGGYSDNATILLSNYRSYTDNSSAYTYLPVPTGSGPGSTDPIYLEGDVFFNTVHFDTYDMQVGSFSYLTILHELGHAVGLSHPGNYDAVNGNFSYSSAADFRQDTIQYSVMSYFAETNTGGDFHGTYPDTLMLLDIMALQALYGANNNWDGNTVYGFNCNAGDIFDFNVNVDPVFCIWDSGGYDTIDTSYYTSSQLINLNSGQFSNIGGLIGNVSIAYGAVIEAATGGSGDDVLIGNDQTNWLKGGAGADQMAGGDGEDLYYVDNAGDVVLETSNGSGLDVVFTTVSYQLGTASHVELLAVDDALTTGAINLVGSNFNQTLRGNAGDNILNGSGGADVMQGLGGNDTYVVDNGGDVIEEQAGGGVLDRVLTSVSYTLASTADIEYFSTADQTATVLLNMVGNNLAQTIVGNAGNNVIIGLGGADIMQGLGGNDTYYVDEAGDQVMESAGQGALDSIYTSVSLTLAAGDDIELLATNGGSQPITLVGNALNQTLIGNAGANVLNGLGGNDIIVGGDGADQIDGGVGVDTIGFGGLSGVNSRLSLTNHLAATGVALGDVFSNIENVVMGAGNDQVFGSATVNMMEGGAGNDQLFGYGNDDRLYGGEGADVLYGGLGADTINGGNGFDYAAYDDATYADFLIDLSARITNTGVAQGDTFTGIESFILGTGHDVAYGNEADNYIYGRGGNDTLFGKEGHDTLFGEAGKDRFIFDNQVNAAHSDVIGDFVSGVDSIGLAHYFYSAAAAGGGLVRFFEGAGITGAAVHAYLGAMLFDTATSVLSFDADGAGTGAAVHVATLTGVNHLSGSDFFFV